MARIFVSYRRKETAGHAGRLFDRLREHFGSTNVFRDVDRLKPGDDFVEALARAVDSADVFILVIGRDWLDVRNQRGERRLDDPTDFIRLELETALRRKILVLPVLVEGATMVDAQELPEPLRPLARRQAIELSEHRWDFDVQELLRRIDEVVKPKRSLSRTAAFRVAAALLLLVTAGLAAWQWGPWQPRTDDVSKESVPGPAPGPAPAAPTPEKAQPPPVNPIRRPDTASAAEPTVTRPESAARSPERTPPSPVEQARRRDKVARATVPAGPSDTPAPSDMGVKKPEPPRPDDPPRSPGSKPPDEPPQPVRVPALTGQSARDAASIITNLGLRLKTEWYNSEQHAPGTVFVQKPQAGTLVERGSEVHLIVAVPLQPNEHAAGRRVLSLAQTINLDRDERGLDVGFDQTRGPGFYLFFPEGAQGSLLPAQISEPLDASRCGAVTLSTSRVLIAEPIQGQGVCLRTTAGRLAVIRLVSLTTEPAELALHYSTLERPMRGRAREGPGIPERRSSVGPRRDASPAAILPPPSQMEPRCHSAIKSPAPGFTFSWQPVDGASTYTVEIDCLGCSGVEITDGRRPGARWKPRRTGWAELS
jgi:TIR domain/PASTA domain